jgi:DNA-binding response OmpR family regulator
LKVLIVDDEKLLVKGIRFNLEQEGHKVEVAYDGEEAIKLAKDKTIDIIVLDLMLPKIDGLTVCQKIREFSTVPIIMLTAKTEDIDKIMGLEYGADDYLTKPFNILELKARIKAILRRVQTQGGNADKTMLTVGGIELDYNARKVVIHGKDIDLTVKEFDLMDLFVTNPGKVYSRENLLDIVWGYDYPGDIRTVDVHVRRLREKVEENPAIPDYILTKWGVGYYFNERKRDIS